MREYNQGDTYTEYAEDDEELEFDESGEDTDAKITKLWGMPLKVVVLGGVSALALVLMLFFFSTRKTESPVDDFVAVDVPDVSEYTEASSAESVEVSSDAVYDIETGTWIEAGSSSDSTTVVNIDDLSTEEQVTLRKLGYTGDEIKVALSNGFDVQGLIDAATALHDAEADEALRRMSDSASEEFRYIVENSYFGQPGWEFVSHADDMWGTFDYIHESYVVNADYVKCPTYGSQLQLKCKIAEDLEVFYIVTPERFASLPEYGNIVLNVEYTIYGENTYVTNITETDSTLDSIDSSNVTKEDLQVNEPAGTETTAPVN